MILVRLNDKISAPIEYGHLEDIEENGFIGCSNIACNEALVECRDCRFKAKDYKVKIEVKISEEEN